MHSVLSHPALVLHPITPENYRTVKSQWQQVTSCESLADDLAGACQPRYTRGPLHGRAHKRQTTFGFYSQLGTELVGLSWLHVSSWPARVGSIGGVTLPQHRGRGVASGSLLFLLGQTFERVGLNRVKCGCGVSQVAYRRVLDTLPGMQFEGLAREAVLDARGDFEDYYRYALLRRDWLRLNPLPTTLSF